VDEVAVASVFRALADPTRREILHCLRNGELAAGDIASRFPISGPSVSRHLAVLKAAGLVTERREANRVMYSLVAHHLALCVGSFLSAVCPEQGLGRHQGKKKAKVPEKGSAKAEPPRKSSEKLSAKDKRRRDAAKAAPGKSAPGKSAPGKSAPDKSALDKAGPGKWGPDKAAPDEPASAPSDVAADQLSATV
jgi:DNA-binding transcriptional ArsR family regulator